MVEKATLQDPVHLSTPLGRASAFPVGHAYEVCVEDYH
jgi:hypothetical protein